MKFIYQIHAVVVTTCLLGLALLAPNQVFGFAGGAATITLNFILLEQVWRRILAKKPVASAMTLIVIKYAILIILLYVFIKELKVPLISFFAGLASLGGSFVIAAVTGRLKT